MPRVTRIDRADAFRAIEAIIQRGEAPTHINVRSELGQRGSPPVISNFISSWFAVYGPALAGGVEGRVSVADSPAAVGGNSSPSLEGGAIAALTAAALEQIQQAAREREQEQARLREAQDREIAEARSLIEAEAAEIALRESAQQAHVDRAYADRDAALKERDLALADAANLRSAMAVLKTQLQAETAHAAALARIDASLASLSSRLTA